MPINNVTYKRGRISPLKSWGAIMPLSLESAASVIEPIIQDCIHREGYGVVLAGIQVQHLRDSVGVVIHTSKYGPLICRDFITRADLDNLKNLEPGFIAYKFARAFNLPQPAHMPSPFNKVPTPVHEPTFTLSELEEAQKIIDELACKAS